MDEMDAGLLMLFWSAMALNLATAIVYLSARKSVWLFFIPWIGLGLGFASFTLCRSYYAQPEVSLSVPIRIDLVLLPPLMFFAAFAGIARLIGMRQKTS